MEINRYLELIVEPTISDFESNPRSIRHAFLAAVVVFHAIDHGFPKGSRPRFRKLSPAFNAVDRITHAFKHASTGNLKSPDIQPLGADQVIERPPSYYGVSGAYGLSRWGDGVGGVTVEGEHEKDLLSIIRSAAAFVRSQIDGI